MLQSGLPDTAQQEFEPVIFGPNDRPILGFLHLPARAAMRGLGVVLCNPLGYEAMSVHRAYRHLAQRLTGCGYAALRFDYEGTGDSSGRSNATGRLRSWVDSIKAAVAETRARQGGGQVALFGVRFGASLAALAAAELGDVEGLIQWAPVVSGRAHVRELKAFRMVQSGKGATKQPTDGGEEIAGYVFSRETLADMSAVDLLAGTGRLARRVLILPRNERAADETRLLQHLKSQGMDARMGHDSGYGLMMRDDPYESVVPSATLDGIVEWLSEKSYPETPGPVPFKATRTVLALPTGPDQTAVLETPLRFGEGRRLFGILTEPDTERQNYRPAVCFLNVGANHHVGPHRMNVEFSRELASRGYLTFRFDVAGLGESPPLPGERENRIYTKDAVDDVKSAMTLLGQMRSAQRFVLVGLCSGAYLAFHTTLADARVSGQILLSSYAFEWKEGDSVAPTVRKTYESTRSYARALLDHRVWLRALRGEVDVRGIAGVLLERFQTQLDAELPSWGASLMGKRRPQNDVEKAMQAMCDRGVQSLLVSSFSDGGLDMIARYLGNDARKMRGRREFELLIPEGTDHTFSSSASQQILLGIITQYLTDRFA